MNASWLTVAGISAWLVDIVWKGTLVMAITGVMAWGLRRWPAAVRHGVWTAGMGCLLVLAALSAGNLGWRVLPGWGLRDSAKQNVASEGVVTPAAGGVEAIKTGVVMKEVNAEEGPVAVPVGVDMGIPAAPVQWGRWLVVVWGVGVILFLSPVLLAPLVFWWMTRKSRNLAGPGWQRLMKESCARMGVRQRVGLVESGGATMPMAVGFWRPRVVLPTEAEKWSEERRRIVVMHELAHIKRRDMAAQTLATAARALYWFHPLVWMGCARMAIERERACDDAVLNTGMGAAVYAETLVEIASGAYRRMTMRYAGLAMARKSTLESRVRAVLDPACRRGVVGRGTLAMIAVAAVSATVLLGVLRAADGPKEGVTLSAGTTITIEKTGGVLSRELPDGGKVELVAIGASGAGPWWCADGTPTLVPEDVRFNPGGGTGRGGFSGGRVLLVHFKLPEESGEPHFILQVTREGQTEQLNNVTWSQGSPGGDIAWWQVREPAIIPHASLTLKVGMTSGKGIKIAEGSGRTEGRNAEGRYLVSELSPVGMVTIAHTFKDGELHAVITTEDGKEHEALAQGQAESDGLSQVTLGMRMGETKSPAKSYRIDLRTIHWVTFENLALAPDVGSETTATTKPAGHTDNSGQIQLTPDLEYYVKNDPSLKNLENMKIGLETELKVNVATFGEHDKQNDTLRLRIQEVQKQIDKMRDDLIRNAGVRLQENLRKQSPANVP